MQEFEEILKEEILLRGLTEVTYKTYFYRIRNLFDHFQKPLSKISIQELRKYFVYLIDIKKSGRETIRNTRYALRFYYVNCLGYEDYTLDFVKVSRIPKIPAVITRKEVRQILANVKIPDYKICLELIYACGLRIGEAVRIKNSDIDGERKILTIRNGKGAKDRTIPLPENILTKLRNYWRTHKNPYLLFPNRYKKENSFDRSKVTKTINTRVIQSAMKAALNDSGLYKCATPHTLRHCYATHMLEAGAHIKAISKYLGHRSLRPTMIYLHMTNNSEIHYYNILTELMNDL